MVLLKSLVIGMGVLIVLGMALLAWGLYHKTNKPEDTAIPSSMPASDGPAATFGDITVDVGQKCSIKTVIPDGDRLWLHLDGAASSCHRVLAIELSSGRILGTVGSAQQ